MTNNVYLLMAIFTTHASISFGNILDLRNKINCVSRAEKTIESLTGTRCSSSQKIKLPNMAKSVLDLRGFSDRQRGACPDFLSRIPYGVRTEDLLSIDLFKLQAERKLPLLIWLPQVTVQSASCKKLCDLANFGVEKPTQFGFAVKIKRQSEPFGPAVPKGFVTVIRVSSPWYYVLGNEGSASPCMDGRPSVLEYGAPLAAIAGAYNDIFGFSTDQLSNNIGYALIDLVPEKDLESPRCAPYKCE